MSLDLARLAADAVLYEGYLLYPYRSTAAKNQVRWQFGVLGPPGAATVGVGEEPDLAVSCLLRTHDDGAVPATVTVHLRFLQLQRRQAERGTPGGFEPVRELRAGGASWISWDEAVVVERELGTFDVADLRAGREVTVEIAGGEDLELVPGGRLVRRRWPLRAVVTLQAEEDGWLLRLRIVVANSADRVAGKDASLRSSLIGTHLLLAAAGAQFVSVIDPPEDARAAAGRCRQHRCWPVLAGDGGPDGQTSDVVLAAPIILYDHPAVAPESTGALFDSTEIDEILTLRVMTLTEEEKAQARATDAHAAAIVDRCEHMTPAELQRLHGVLRQPHAAGPARTGDDWWAAEAAAPTSPDSDAVLIAGKRIARGSRVLLHPTRRADAHDMFFAGREARVSGVHIDLDGETHVAVTLLDDPAADMHDWYGRYLYFAPDELEPLVEAEGRPPRGAGTSERRARHEDARSDDHAAAGGRVGGGRRPRHPLGPGREALSRDAPDVAGRTAGTTRGDIVIDDTVIDDDGTEPAAHLREEPQAERGAPGSRDTGSDEPGGGPVDRPDGISDEDSDTTVDAQGAQHPDAPNLPTGDQAG